MTEKEALGYLFSLPSYQSTGTIPAGMYLKNILSLCEIMGNPQNKFKSIHVAGTNGKGSSSHMLASVFQESDYKVGLHTSPHLINFTERVKVNGVEMPMSAVAIALENSFELIKAVEPSFFEMSVAIAFHYFAQVQVDIAIVEVGMGGRLDATNIIMPEISLITNIGYDHTNFLGDTLSKIAFEKAGIIKKGTPVIISEYQEEIEYVFRSTANELNSDLMYARDLVTDNTKYSTDLMGKYQDKNILGVLGVIKVMNTLGWEIRESAIINGLNKVIYNTDLKGRWDVINEKPLIVLDTGHNVEAFDEIVSQISQIKFNQLHLVLGFSNGKDIKGIIDLLPLDANFVFCEPKVERAAPLENIRPMVNSALNNVSYISDVNQAFKSTLSIANQDDLIFVGGSTFVLSELYEFFSKSDLKKVLS